MDFREHAQDLSDRLEAAEQELREARVQLSSAKDIRYLTTTRHCPECGSYKQEHGTGLETSHRHCLDCGQEWFTDIEYPVSKQGNYERVKAAERELARMKAVVEAAKEFVAQPPGGVGAYMALRDALAALKKAQESAK